MFSANGVRPAQNNYLLDGIDNNTSNVDFLSGVAYIVKTPGGRHRPRFEVLTSSFSAEYGRAGGAVLNTTLKSGTNELHGAGWGFNRNEKFNAADFFADRARSEEGQVPVQSVSAGRWAGRSSGARRSFLPTTKAV